MNKLKVAAASIGVLLAGAGIMLLLVAKKRDLPVEQPEARPPLVTVIEARPVDHRFRMRTHGTVLPRTEVTLSAEVPGRVLEAAPAFAGGGFFEAGDVLLRIDPRDFELALVRARAALAEAQVRFAREEAEAEIARAEWEGLGRGESSPLLLREPQLAEAQAAVDSARATVEQAELDLKRTEIVAPFAGRVRQKHLDVGGYAAPGAPVAAFYSVDAAEVRLPVSVDQLAFVDLPLEYRGGARPDAGPEVVLSALFAGERFQWTGRIVRTEGEIDQRTRTIIAVAEVADPYGDPGNEGRPPLAAGLFVEAEIMGNKARNVLLLPRVSIRNRNMVFVVDEEDRLRYRRVEVLRTEREQVVVRGGIEPGQWICVSPIEAPVDGMRVRPRREGAVLDERLPMRQ